MQTPVAKVTWLKINLENLIRLTTSKYNYSLVIYSIQYYKMDGMFPDTLLFRGQ